MDEPRKIVAVDNELSNIRQALENEGIEVVDIKEYPQHAAVAIITGQDDNLLGRMDRAIEAHIVDATGKDIGEVVSTVKKRLELI